MKIKKFEGTTEEEAIEKVKAELGLDALIVNIKKVQPRGMFAFLRKPVVEVTAAYEEKEQEDIIEIAKKTTNKQDDFEKNKEGVLKAAKKTTKEFDRLIKDNTINQQKQKIKGLEEQLTTTEKMLEKAMSHMSILHLQQHSNKERKYQNNLIQIFYDTLLEQGVQDTIANQILDDIDLIEDEDKIDINLIVKIVYNKIINILGKPEPLEINRNNRIDAKVIAFIGSTGVGKTTTIAKLSADFILNEKLNVGLITADTYRIAAVDQLKTYAEILGVEVEVVYNKSDLEKCMNDMKSINDVVLIDTAGRSHKNKENLNELKELLSVVPNCEKFLVLSLTTKYEDLLNIAQTYSKMTNYKIIFTKLDETLKYGSILNLCYMTGEKISYVTMGQNVPDDIEILKPEKIAKALLGLGESD